MSSERTSAGASGGTPQAYEGLFNKATLVYGTNETTVTTNAATVSARPTRCGG